MCLLAFSLCRPLNRPFAHCIQTTDPQHSHTCTTPAIPPRSPSRACHPDPHPRPTCFPPSAPDLSLASCPGLLEPTSSSSLPRKHASCCAYGAPTGAGAWLQPCGTASAAAAAAAAAAAQAWAYTSVGLTSHLSLHAHQGMPNRTAPSKVTAGAGKAELQSTKSCSSTSHRCADCTPQQATVLSSMAARLHPSVTHHHHYCW